MNRNTITPPTSNIVKDHSTEEAEGYTQFLQSLDIQYNINMDQDQETFIENKFEEDKEEENPPQQDPPTIIK